MLGVGVLVAKVWAVGSNGVNTITRLHSRRLGLERRVALRALTNDDVVVAAVLVTR